MTRSLLVLAAILLALAAAPGCSGDKDEPEEMKKSGRFMGERNPGGMKPDGTKSDGNMGGRLPRPRGK